MKAIVWTKYGLPDDLQLKDVEKPTSKDHEILIKVHATAVTAGNCEMRWLELPLMWNRLPRLIYMLKPGVNREMSSLMFFDHNTTLSIPAGYKSGIRL